MSDLRDFLKKAEAEGEVGKIDGTDWNVELGTIVELIAEKTGFTVKDVKIVMELFLEEVKSCLVEGNHLEIRNFGTFKVKNHKARKARNPKTGQEVVVPARRKAAFKVSRELNKMLK